MSESYIRVAYYLFLKQTTITILTTQSKNTED